MLDEERRELERVLKERPDDEAAALRYLAALRRSGAVAPDGTPDQLEPVETGLLKGARVLVVRRAFPRSTFHWLPEMDELIGQVATVVRVARDRLTVELEGPSLVEGHGLVIGRSVGAASVVEIP